MTSHEEPDSSPRPWGLLVRNAEARSRTTTSTRGVLYDVKLFPCFTELLTWNFRATYLGLDFHGFNVLKSISVSQIKSASMGTCGLIKTEKLLAFYQILCWWQIPIHKHPVSTAGLSKTVLCLIPVSLDGEISPVFKPNEAWRLTAKLARWGALKVEENRDIFCYIQIFSSRTQMHPFRWLLWPHWCCEREKTPRANQKWMVIQSNGNLAVHLWENSKNPRH